jgi:hypothetical protein
VAVEAPPSTLGKQGKCITRANRQCKIRSDALRGSAGVLRSTSACTTGRWAVGPRQVSSRSCASFSAEWTLHLPVVVMQKALFSVQNAAWSPGTARNRAFTSQIYRVLPARCKNADKGTGSNQATLRTPRQTVWAAHSSDSAHCMFARVQTWMSCPSSLAPSKCLRDAGAAMCVCASIPRIARAASAALLARSRLEGHPVMP